MHLAHHERLNRSTGLAVLSSDALSSVAYATGEILRTLLVAGVAVLSLSTPIALVIAGLLIVVALLHRQTVDRVVEAFSGGVALNLGLKAGTQFVVVGDRDVVILKSIAPPAMEEFDDLVRNARSAARKTGMKAADVKRAIARVSASR